MTKLSATDRDEAHRYGYSDQSWLGLSDRDKELLRLVQPSRRATYVTNVNLSRLDAFLKDQDATAQRMGGTFALNPDFQRGHVWDTARQIAYVENYLRGNAPALFRFNSPAINGSTREAKGDLHPYDFVCIDGLQRITALTAFAQGELPVFGGLTATDLKGTLFDPLRLNLTTSIEVFDFAWKEDLLSYYIALNSGGVVHAPEEIDRVKALRVEAQAERKSRLDGSAPGKTERRARRAP